MLCELPFPKDEVLNKYIDYESHNTHYDTNNTKDQPIVQIDFMSAWIKSLVHIALRHLIISRLFLLIGCVLARIYFEREGVHVFEKMKEKKYIR